MKWKDLVLDGYGRIPGFLAGVIEGLTRQDLEWQPRPDTNSIGWLVWHLTRQQDAQVSALMGRQQLWTMDEWHSRFDRPADVDDTGFGHTPEQVRTFRSPTAGILLDYNRAVVERTQNYIRRLPAQELGRQLDEPWFQPLPTIGIRLVSIMNDSLLHAGQAAYIRGLLQGKGWQKY